MQLRSKRVASFFAIALTLWLAFAPQTFAQFVSTERLNDTPDLTQTDTRCSLPGGGKEFCAPVAVSNSIVWLAHHGYSQLINGTGNDLLDQINVAQALGQPDCMNTNTVDGTTVINFLRGVSKYVTDRGYKIARLQYEGWRLWNAPEFASGSRTPRLNWIEGTLQRRAVSWIQIGWYNYDPATNQYNRTAGHWVTLVGCGVDQNGNPAPDVLVVNNPGAASGYAPSHQYIRLAPLSTGGKLVRGKAWQDATGFYRIADGFPIKKSCQFGIIDGAAVLELQ